MDFGALVSDALDWVLIIFAGLAVLSLLALPIANRVLPKPTKEDEERAKRTLKENEEKSRGMGSDHFPPFW